MNKNVVQLALLALLSGCAATTEPFVPKTPLIEKIDQRLLTRCDQLPEDVAITSEEALIEQKGKEAALYSACSKRHDALATAIEGLHLENAYVDPTKAQPPKKVP